MKLLNMRIAITTIGILFLFSTFSSQAQTISTVAGNGVKGYGGDGGVADSAMFGSQITGVSVDNYNNVYIADAYNNCIRKVTSDGIINTIAGNGIAGYSGDGGSATSASLYNPFAILPDSLGNLYIADNVNGCVRKVSANGKITTIAGTAQHHGYSGDGGLATAAKLQSPWALALDNTGSLYISDAYNNVIRKVDIKGIITTIAGSGAQGFSGDGGLATAATLYKPAGIAFDKENNLFVADYVNNCVRKVTPSGIISTVAGIGGANYGYSGDEGLATLAQLNHPFGLAIDSLGNLFIADGGNSRIRKVDLNGIITTIAGTNTHGFGGDGGLATEANLNNPESIAIDNSGNMFIADAYNYRVRKITSLTLPITLSSFTANTINNTIQTNWHTSTELNTVNFIIQHSIDGSSFTDIATVKANGSGANGYQFTDNNPSNGINYYGLESLDKDGSFTYSKIVSVQFTVNSNQFAVFPNPSKDKVTVKGSHIVSVQVIDNLGRVIKSQTLKDATNPTLSVVSIKAGVYHLRVQTTGGKVSGVGFVKE